MNYHVSLIFSGKFSTNYEQWLFGNVSETVKQQKEMVASIFLSLLNHNSYSTTLFFLLSPLPQVTKFKFKLNINLGIYYLTGTKPHFVKVINEHPFSKGTPYCKRKHCKHQREYKANNISILLSDAVLETSKCQYLTWTILFKIQSGMKILLL